MKLKTLKILFTIAFFSFLNLSAQEHVNNNSINCDSLLETMNYNCLISVKPPTPLKSLAEIQNEFISKVDTNLLKQTIYIKVIVDTSGTVLCPEVIKGNSNITDSIALSYVTELKFIPSNIKGRKLSIQIIIPFYKWSLYKTKKMIKVAGKWIPKE